MSTGKSSKQPTNWEGLDECRQGSKGAQDLYHTGCNFDWTVQIGCNGRKRQRNGRVFPALSLATRCRQLRWSNANYEASRVTWLSFRLVRRSAAILSRCSRYDSTLRDAIWWNRFPETTIASALSCKGPPRPPEPVRVLQVLIFIAFTDCQIHASRYPEGSGDCCLPDTRQASGIYGNPHVTG